MVYSNAQKMLENGSDFQASQCIPMDLDAAATAAAAAWRLTFGVFIPLESMSWRL